MLQTVFLGLLASVLILAHAVQVPLRPTYRGQDDHPASQTILDGDGPAKWAFNDIPNPNVTDHLVFETAYSLLQHWPNTRMRNGHNIVPGIIPEGTLLYHGTNHEEIPEGPEWVALDPEHAYIYCKEQTEPGHSQQECWQLTLMNTRPLKVIYFDGKSAAKLPGPLDTQDLLAFGKSGSERMHSDTERIENLCKWGSIFGVDGFVRMEMAFEVMLCNFTSATNAVSFNNIVSSFGLQDASTLVIFESLHAGAWHNHFPGETRIQLDLAGLVSFYDTQLAPSLVAVRAGQERWDHRVQEVSKEDLSAVVSRLEATLTRPLRFSSGVDWETLIQIIVDRYAGRLELVQHLLHSSATTPDEILDLAVKAQTQLKTMLTPYMHLSAAPTHPTDKTALSWAAPIYEDCATTHTDYMKSKLDLLTESEKLLLRSVRGTNREICRVITKMWAAGVYAGIDPSLKTKETIDTGEVTEVWNDWAADLDRLMGWLDWNVWIKCKPACGPEEICFVHVWPPFYPESSFTQEAEDHTSGTMEPGRSRAVTIENLADDPFRGEPKCVSLVNP